MMSGRGGARRSFDSEGMESNLETESEEAEGLSGLSGGGVASWLDEGRLCRRVHAPRVL